VKPANYGNGAGIAFIKLLIEAPREECVFWPFSHNGLGYGRVGYLGETHYAHRLACELAHGKPPTERHQAAHACGNGMKGCVNPGHLSWKTNSENQLDRRIHGTRGERKLKLTADDVIELRSLKGKVGLFELAERFGVSRGCVEYWLKDDRSPSRLKKRALVTQDDHVG